MTKRVIIAGTDGSLAAVQWAAAEAQRRSTVTQLPHHADCPVLITHPHLDDKAAR